MTSVRVVLSLLLRRLPSVVLAPTPCLVAQALAKPCHPAPACPAAILITCSAGARGGAAGEWRGDFTFQQQWQPVSLSWS